MPESKAWFILVCELYKHALNLRALYPHPVLLLEDGNGENSLVISDLHLGFEHEISEKGISFRSPSINEMLTDLMHLIEVHFAKRVIILGDLKHTIGSINKGEWKDVPTFLERLSSKAEIFLVPGNHDANIRHLIPTHVNFMAPAGMVQGDTLLVHGHAALPQQPMQISHVVMGHSHPVFLKRSSVLNGQQVWVYLRVSRQALFSEGDMPVDLIILPSFNKYLHSPTGEDRKIRKHSRSASPITSRILDNKDLIIRCIITTLDGAIVGDADSLHYVID